MGETEARIALTPPLQSALQEMHPGTFLTGYLVAFEYLGDDGIHRMSWLTGTGADPSDGEEHGLMHHRIAGMLWEVEAQIRFHHNRGGEQ